MGQDSTFQRPPTKVLIDALTANTVVVSGNVITINDGKGNIISFDKTTDLNSCYKDCRHDGTKQVVTVAVALDSTCNCLNCFELRLVRNVQGTRRLSDTYPQTRFYKGCIPKGMAVNDTNFDTAMTDLAAQINADTLAPATASYNTGTNTFTFTARENGINVFSVAPMNGTITNTPGTAPALSQDDIFRLFPLKPDTFGQKPGTPSGANYCVYYFNLIKANVTNDPVEGGVEGRNLEYYFYVNNDLSNFKTDWDTELNTALTCVSTATFCTPAVGTVIGSTTTAAALSLTVEFAALAALGLTLVSVVVDDSANNLGINPAVTLTAAQVAAATPVVTTDTTGTVDVVITTKECTTTIHAQVAVTPSGTFNLLVV